MRLEHVRHTDIIAYENARADSGHIAAISGHDIGTFDEQEVIIGTYIAKAREQAAAVRRQIEFGTDRTLMTTGPI